MIWLITLFLCAILFVSFIAVLYPQLVFPPLANYWRKRTQY